MLTALLLMPILGAAALGVVPARRVRLIRALALVETTFILAFAWSLLGQRQSADQAHAPGRHRPERRRAKNRHQQQRCQQFLSFSPAGSALMRIASRAMPEAR